MATTQRFIEPHEQPQGWSWSREPGDATRPIDAREPASGSEGPRRSTDTDDVQGAHDDERPGATAEPTVDLDAPVYVISVAAAMSDLHPQTLRAYERDGLLEPARTPGGTRRYSRRDIERLRLIRRLTQDEGLNLAGVRLALELGEKLDGARRRIVELEEVVRVLAERIEQRPATSRYEIVKTPPSGMEVHRSSRRTGSRGPAPVQRARPLPPPELRTTGA
jgi:MerR family transcriptional regulator/heat shock protein HspR